MNFKVNKKLVKLGRSWGVIIPPWFLKVLDIEPDKADIVLSIEDDKIIIEKVSPKL